LSFLSHSSFSEDDLLEEILSELKEEISEMTRKPCLAIIQVGSTTEGNKSVNIKKSLCKEIGIVTLEYLFPENINEETLLQTGQKPLSLSVYTLTHSILLTLLLPQWLI
jgi:methylenetetrahydrofolate dehydrogenase (NADP+) / methenyltetrahydrofolate cyclohydrolase